MKKITLSLILVSICLTSIAQFEIKYNRFRHTREEHIIIAKELTDSYKNIEIDCNDEEIRSETKTYKSIYHSDTASIESKQDVLRELVHINCQEVIDFYVDILHNDPNKQIKADAILYLGWLNAKSNIPVLLEVAKKENNLRFANRIAFTLCLMEEFELAASILDRVCFNEDGSVNKDCIENYEYAGREELVRNYWLSEWEKDNDENRKLTIALHLTKHGAYDISFSVIKEALEGTDTYKRRSAINGLATIASEEALELIQNCMNDEDVVVANYAKSVITSLKEGGSYTGRREK